MRLPKRLPKGTCQRCFRGEVTLYPLMHDSGETFGFCKKCVKIQSKKEIYHVIKKETILKKCKVCRKEFETTDERRVTDSPRCARYWQSNRKSIKKTKYCEVNDIIIPDHYCQKFCVEKCAEYRRTLEELFPEAPTKRDFLVNK